MKGKIKKITYEAERCNFKVCVTQEDSEYVVKFYYITSTGEIIGLGDFKDRDGSKMDLSEDWIYKKVQDIFEDFAKYNLTTTSIKS